MIIFSVLRRNFDVFPLFLLKETKAPAGAGLGGRQAAAQTKSLTLTSRKHSEFHEDRQRAEPARLAQHAPQPFEAQRYEYPRRAADFPRPDVD